MLSVENLEPGLKAKYRQLAIFLDDVVIPTKVSSEHRSQWHISRLSQVIHNHK